ncbi:hypothetical protein [Thalassotalea sp. G2M2-11]|uniref:hypothetical protein n=1 Tax=Thalassotalea sp. G2M2-11 TaxID=2787627 RepID=UPI0019CF8177|nr:hypothetical protein [Thalassotalea sp. G2M2-11]
MDIFTTALTRVRATPIKPENLRVKALKKESATQELTDDIHHLEDHQLYFIDEKTHQNNKQQHQQQPSNEEESFPEHVKASEDVITHKQEILHPQPTKDDEQDDDVKHLDIFI